MGRRACAGVWLAAHANARATLQFRDRHPHTLLLQWLPLARAQPAAAHAAGVPDLYRPGALGGWWPQTTPDDRGVCADESVLGWRVRAARMDPMTTRNRLRMQTSQLAGAIRTPQGALRAILLLGLLALWFAVGVWTFSTPIVDSVSQYDLVVLHAAGREALAGGDPYSQEFIASLHADPHGTGYAYPLASLWVLLPFLPFPIAWAATLWVSVSICALVALAPLLGDTRLNWIWLAPLLFYPSLYALKIVQWAPLQIGLLGLSLWLFRRDQPLLSGILAPLVTVKPTTGIGLALLAALLCGSNKRWWQGAMLGGVFWYGTPLLLQPDWPWRWLHTLQTYADPAARQFLLTLTDLP